MGRAIQSDGRDAAFMKMFIVNAVDQTEIEIAKGNEIAFGEGHDRIVVLVRDGRVEARSLQGGLVILPQVSNVVALRNDPHWRLR